MKHIIFACCVKKDLFRIAPIIKRLKNNPADFKITVCYCGPEVNYNLHKNMYDQIGLPGVDFQYLITSASLDDQIFQLSSLFEETLAKIKPDLIVIPSYYYLALGYTTLLSHFEIPVCMLDAGLRDFTETEPMKNYRSVIDSVTSLFLVSEENSIKNLLAEEVDPAKIFYTGNTLYDCLSEMNPFIDQIDTSETTSKDKFVLGYLFTNQAVFAKDQQKVIIESLKIINKYFSIRMPVSSAYAGAGIEKIIKAHDLNLKIAGRLEYPDYLALLKKAQFIITDSCSIQEEATFFGIPCISLLDKSERSNTENQGTNIPIGLNTERLENEINKPGKKETQKSIPVNQETKQPKATDLAASCISGFLKFQS
jgi:UDP-N-acetylglucosamine 2-epimerase (non-hydrolysing)